MPILGMRIFRPIYLLALPTFAGLSAWWISQDRPVDSLAFWIIPLKCPVHFLTGWLCPTCGLGRSLMLSFAGELRVALEHHFLGPVLAAILAFWWLDLLFKWQKVPAIFQRVRAIRWPPKAVILALGVYVVWGLGRNF